MKVLGSVVALCSWHLALLRQRAASWAESAVEYLERQAGKSQMPGAGRQPSAARPRAEGAQQASSWNAPRLFSGTATPSLRRSTEQG